jgi:hypothetical protein
VVGEKAGDKEDWEIPVTKIPQVKVQNSTHGSELSFHLVQTSSIAEGTEVGEGANFSQAI